MRVWDHATQHFDRLWSTSTELRRGAPREGLLQRVTPRTRLICAVLLLLGVLVSDKLGYLVAVYLLCAFAALFSYIEIGRYMWRNLVLVLVFVLPVTAFGVLSFVTPGQVFMSIGPLHFTVQGLKSVVFVVLRALCAISITMLLIRSLGVQGVLRAFREAKMPASMVAVLQIAIAHIHVLGRTAHAMIQAARARTVAELPMRRVYATTATQGAVLLQKSMQTSRQLHGAMLARGFEGRFVTAHVPERLRGLDYVLMGVCAASAAAGFVL